MNLFGPQNAASRCDAATRTLACGCGILFILTTSMVGCDSNSAGGHASNRALRSPMAVNDPSYEAQVMEPPHALVVVELPNDSHDQPHVSTVIDPLLGRPTNTGTELQLVTPATPVGTGLQLQPTTAPTTAPATKTLRGSNDSTTQP